MLKSKENYRHASVMLLAEEENSPIVIKAMELGVNDYFIYPVDESELLARTKTQLRKKLYQDNLRNELEQSVNLSIKDGLTGVFNRRYFDIHIQRMITQSADSKRSICLVMFDIDRFKKVNDAYGHQTGDEILKTFANILKTNFKVTDLIARFGGEEFCVILNDINLNDALAVAERLRAIVESTIITIESLDKILNMSVSIGVAELKAKESAMELFGRADAALYKAKETGRNKVVAAET
jgi:two-component system cell cycle response regulator